MSKVKKSNVVTKPLPTMAVPTAAPVAQVTYTVVPPKRPLTGLKFGEKGNAYTHAMLAEAAKANGGTLTAAQAMAVCIAAQHKGFYSYAINRLHVLQPSTAQAPLAVGAL